jgi:hypothetical protein
MTLTHQLEGGLGAEIFAEGDGGELTRTAFSGQSFAEGWHNAAFHIRFCTSRKVLADIPRSSSRHGEEETFSPVLVEPVFDQDALVRTSHLAGDAGKFLGFRLIPNAAVRLRDRRREAARAAQPSSHRRDQAGTVFPHPQSWLPITR